jgi:23S rRNA (cytidine1920-2'-O)/16S rRNA (cytidine1409-2'-O)-methyltransferase
VPSQRVRPLIGEVARRFPDRDDPAADIAAGRITVNGLIVRNPRTRVRSDVSIALAASQPLRGEAKLTAALDRFAVPVAGRVTLDLGAAAGGFTRALLDGGAARVYAVDAGYGQLLGSLRADPRVVNLERTNLADIDRCLIPQQVELVTIDLSYLAVAAAVPQLAPLDIAEAADLVALVKPMFELGRGTLPRRPDQWADALGRARRGVERAGWTWRGTLRSPVEGAGGAVEFLVHWRRRR